MSSTALLAKCIKKSRIEKPVLRTLQLLEIEECAAAGVWSGSSSKTGKMEGDLDIIIFATPHEKMNDLISLCEENLLSDALDVVQITPFLQFMGTLVTVYYAPDYTQSVDFGVVGENWWDIIRIEPYAKFLWMKENFSKVETGLSWQVERSPKCEFWICVWKIRKAVLRKNIPRARAYLDRARRALLSGYMFQKGLFHYPDRPEHFLKDLDCYTAEYWDNFFYAVDKLKDIAVCTSSIIDKSYQLFDFSPQEHEGLNVINSDILSSVEEA